MFLFMLFLKYLIGIDLLFACLLCLFSCVYGCMQYRYKSCVAQMAAAIKQGDLWWSMNDWRKKR